MRNSSSLDWLRFMHTPNDYRVSRFILPLKIAAEGTRYSKEFAAFLKETYGHIPGDLPYA